MPLIPLTFITFLVLKLTDTIDWSWWWITAPLWGGAVLAIVFMLFLGAMAAFMGRTVVKVARTVDRELSL